jgi:hypothetical protein
MKRRRTKVTAADDLMVGPPQIGVPILGQSHALVAVGIGGRKKRSRPAPLKQRLIAPLKRLRRRHPDLDSWPSKKIKKLIVEGYPRLGKERAIHPRSCTRLPQGLM